MSSRRLGWTTRNSYTITIAPPRPGTFLTPPSFIAPYGSLPNTRSGGWWWVGGGHRFICLVDTKIPLPPLGRRERDKIRVVLSQWNQDPPSAAPFSLSSLLFLNRSRPPPSVSDLSDCLTPPMLPAYLVSWSLQLRDPAVPCLRVIAIVSALPGTCLGMYTKTGCRSIDSMQRPTSLDYVHVIKSKGRKTNATTVKSSYLVEQIPEFL